MPTRAQVQDLTLFIADLYNEIESEILVNAAKSLKMSDGLTAEGYPTYQAEQLRRLGPLTAENIQIMQKHSERTAEELDVWIQAIGTQSAAETDADLAALLPDKATRIPPAAQSSAIAAILTAYGNQAKEVFNLTNTTMLKEAQALQMEILNKVSAQVVTGQKTPQQALVSVVREAADRGIALPLPESKTGQKWQLEGYVNMITRTTSGQLAADMQFARMDEFGVDLVEISSHMGARPKCAPYQGRIYSRSGKSKIYPALSSTSYGEKDGLKGINCGHNFYPFVHGKNEKTFEPYDKAENDRVYRESQEQRKIEREIRKAKKQAAVMGGLGDEDAIKAANQKVKDKQLKMREYLGDTGRTRRYDRERVVAP